MRKKILSFAFILMVCSAIPSYQIMPAFAATNNQLLIINELELLETDEKLTEGAKLTRAQFAQILCNMAQNTTDVEVAYLSTYPDVSLKYWAADYIHTAVSNGWMSGTLNGNFNPDEQVTYSQALYGILKVIGFTNEHIPQTTSGIVSFAKKQGLCDGISITNNSSVTTSTCSKLLYNALKVNVNGKMFGSAFGCTLNSSDEINLTEYIANNLQGPIIANGAWKNEIPFSMSNATIYRDDKKVSASSIKDYDVLYYSTSLKTVWAYSDKITGIVKDLIPSSINPTSVKIGNTEYKLGTDTMIEEFSVFGNTSIGSNVSALLGMDGSIVGLVGLDTYEEEYTGIVLSSEEKVVEGSLTETATHITIVSTSGSETELVMDIDESLYSAGDLVQVSYKNSEISIKKISTSNYKGVYGTVNEDSTKLGTYTLASGVQILDSYEDRYTTVYPSRLAGSILYAEDVLYYELNSNNEITQLILNNYTHDFYDFGISLSTTSSKVTYDVNGNQATASYDGLNTSLNVGSYTPSGFLFNSNGTEIEDIFMLTQVYAQSISSNEIEDNYGNTYALDDNVIYYYKDYLSYEKINLEDAGDLSQYYVYGYYDKPFNEGGNIRLVVLSKKSN